MLRVSPLAKPRKRRGFQSLFPLIPITPSCHHGEFPFAQRNACSAFRRWRNHENVATLWALNPLFFVHCHENIDGYGRYNSVRLSFPTKIA